MTTPADLSPCLPPATLPYRMRRWLSSPSARGVAGRRRGMLERARPVGWCEKCYKLPSMLQPLSSSVEYFSPLYSLSTVSQSLDQSGGSRWCWGPWAPTDSVYPMAREVMDATSVR